MLLQVSGLENDLPTANRIANGFLPGEGSQMVELSIDVIENALPEVTEAIRERYAELDALEDN